VAHRLPSAGSRRSTVERVSVVERHMIENPGDLHPFTSHQALIDALLWDKVSVRGCVRNLGDFWSSEGSRLLAFPMEFTKELTRVTMPTGQECAYCHKKILEWFREWYSDSEQRQLIKGLIAADCPDSECSQRVWLAYDVKEIDCLASAGNGETPRPS
jgi:hypothetical protein